MNGKRMRAFMLFCLSGIFLFGCNLLDHLPRGAKEEALPVAEITGTETITPASSLETTQIPATTQAVAVPTAAPPNGVPVFDLTQDFAAIQAASGFRFAEGPAASRDGSVYFSDVDAGRIYQWSPDGAIATFLDGLNAPNGLAFDTQGNLVVCEGGNGRLVSIDANGQVAVLANQFNGNRFNEPNDLWIDPDGGIYFSDPAYHSAVTQEGENVYYITPDRSQVLRVIDDMVRPNGLVGTVDGSTLYVADHGAGLTYAYDINSDGTLFDKRLFVPTGSDGMELDSAGNLYLTVPNQVQIYDPAGTHLKDIPLAENPTNLAFAGSDGSTLFITARTALFTIRMPVKSAGNGNASPPAVNDPTFTLTSPEVTEGGALTRDYTCDGASSTLAIAWSNPPAGTQSYAVIMHHVASTEDVHWYWVLYNIPAEVISLEKNYRGIGTLGTNSVNGRNEYAPPCSKGPGEKMYTYTVYALSGYPQVSVEPQQVSRDVLLQAISSITLASAELHVTYTRS